VKTHVKQYSQGEMLLLETKQSGGKLLPHSDLQGGVFLEEIPRSRQRKREIVLGTWNIRSLYRAGSLMAVARELARYKLNLVGVQEVRWDKGVTVKAGDSRLIPYAEEVIGDHQCGFQCNRSATDHIFCIRQILEKKWEYNEAVHQLFIDFKKVYNSVRKEVLYNILIEFGIPKKLVKLIKMCPTETYSRVRVGKNLSHMFPIRNGLKHGDALSPFFSTLLWSMPLGWFR